MTISKGNIRQGELYLVNFNPSVGHEFRGKRPALVIQADSQLGKSNLATVMPLTSNLKNQLSDDILIRRDNRNNLWSDSVIKVYDIYSFDYARLLNRIGIVDDRIIKQVKDYLKKHFGVA